MISVGQVNRFCREDISTIENYAQAVDDTTKIWHCHHRLESDYTMQELKDLGCYYGRTACELIFLTPSQHHKTYHKGYIKNQDFRQKISEANKGKKRKPFSEEHKLKISEANKGKKRSDETCRKIGESKIGNKSKLGQHLNEDTKRKISAANKGKSPWNEGKHWKLVDGKQVYTKGE